MQSYCKNIVSSLAVLGLVMGIGAVSNAQVLTQTLTYGSAGSPINTTFNSTLSFNQFDTVGGTFVLDSVQITLSASNVQSYNVINPDNTGHTYTTIETHGTTTVKDGTSVSLTAAVVNDQVFYNGLPHFIGVGANDAYGPFTLTSSSNATYTSGAIYNEFIGTGTIPLTFHGIGQDDSIGDSNLSYNPHTSGYGSGTIVYTYHRASTGTPEPGVAALLGSSLVGLVLFGAKRIRK